VRGDIDPDRRLESHAEQRVAIKNGNLVTGRTTDRAADRPVIGVIIVRRVSDDEFRRQLRDVVLDEVRQLPVVFEPAVRSVEEYG
jgi:hypothetical protein